MSIFKWVRDLLGIRLDEAQREKIDLEKDKLKEEKREKLIKPVDQKDVEEYDPKTQKLLAKLHDKLSRAFDYFILMLILILIAILMIIFIISQFGAFFGKLE